MTKKTRVSIQAEQFFINNQITYKGVTWKGKPIEGLLMNTRMVQGIFDDLNPDTKHQWAYKDTGVWDANRNTQEFVDAMPSWKEHGVLAFTLNLQGGSPYGYSQFQPWINSALEADGSLREDYLARLKRILDRADELGMVVILGIFYFGQEKCLSGEDAIKEAVKNTTQWLLNEGYENVIIEINNECNVHYKQALLMPEGVHELILLAKAQHKEGKRLLVGTSYGGGTVPKPNVVKASDFLLIHGNGVSDPKRICEMVQQSRQVEGYNPMPILFNEDDHFDFEKKENNFVTAVSEYASWGYFDYRMENEGYDQGYQSVPVNWGISSKRKKDFFDLAKRITQGD